MAHLSEHAACAGAALWAGFAACAAGGAHAAGAVGETAPVTVHEPRLFGRFVGDVLERHIEVDVPQPFRLSVAELPKARRIGAWLELQVVGVAARTGADSIRYRIDLKYQIIGSPDEPLMTELPALDLHFVDRDRSFHRPIAEMPVAIGPLAAGGARLGLPALLPARAPPLLDVRPVRRRLWAEGAAVVLLMVGLAVQRYAPAFGSRRRRPFAAARSRVRKLARLPPDGAHRRTAFRALHRAFDETWGRRMFLEHLDEFMAQRPQFADLREPAARFFAESRREFFAGGPAGAEAHRLDWLADLCAAFCARERRAGL